MPNFVSPGVYVIEKDVSDYSPTINSSVVGIVGFASRGPIAGLNNNTATLITSPSQLIDTFGEPSESIQGQALEGALEILEATNVMRFIRVADASKASASGAATVGACPAFFISGTAADPIQTDNPLMAGMSAIGSMDNTTSNVQLSVTAYDNLRTATKTKVFSIPAGTLTTSASNGATTIAALKKVMGGSLDSDKLGAFALSNDVNASSFIVGLAAGKTATLDVKMEVWNGVEWKETLGLAPLNGEGDKLAATSNGTASGVSVRVQDCAYKIDSLYPGAGYNAGTKADGTTSGVSFEVGAVGGVTTTEQVNNLGVGAESFKAGLTSGAFLETAIGTTYDDRTSDYITAQFVGNGQEALAVTSLADFTTTLSYLGSLPVLKGYQGDSAEATVDPRFVKLVQGTYNLVDGNNGMPTDAADIATAIVGKVETTGGKTGIEALDDPILNISIALAPGPGVGNLQNVQNALITVAERSTDFLALISPPYGVGTVGNAIDWSNGFGDERTSAMNSSYAALYWPWVKVFQVWDKKDRWLAPEIYGARQIGVTDAVSDPWFAPAGFVRGRLTKPTDVEVILNQGDRDSMYSGGNVLNPIVNFPQNGIAIFGQRTTQRQPSALDRINVRRMMIYIKKQILASTQRLVFEPNDRFTWKRVEELLNPMFADIAMRRGITEFKVVCDKSTNTPVRVDRNEMWTKVMIKPTKSAEMVIFELNLTSQSASF